MGKRGNPDKPTGSGRGSDGDGQDGTKHGSGEPMPEQGGDGQDPDK